MRYNVLFRKLKNSNNFINIFTDPIVSAVGCNFGDQPGNDVKNLAAAFEVKESKQQQTKWQKTQCQNSSTTRFIQTFALDSFF